MATITLLVNLDGGGSVSASLNVSDADVARAQAALAFYSPNSTNQQIMHNGLLRILQQIKALTLGYEKQKASVPDIVIS